MVDPIAEFQKECAQFPAQYTPEWFARIDSIGGSEMNDLAQSPLDLVANKLRKTLPHAPPSESAIPTVRVVPARTHAHVDSMMGISILGSDKPTTIDEPPPANIKTVSLAPEVAMGWGTLFEPVLCEYVARRLAQPIECRAVSYFKDPWRFSPDGVFRDADGNCALLEMKNPYTRVWANWDATRNDSFALPGALSSTPAEVPDHYIPQLQMGLHLIPFLAYAFYVEAIYRRATLRGTSCAIGLQKMRDVRDAPILDTGIVGFYHPAGTGNLKTAHNFGSLENDFILCHVLTHQRAGADSFVPVYAFKSPRDLPKEHEGIPLFGYMPWNLLGVHAVKVVRDPQFMTAQKEENARIITAIVREQINSATTHEQKIRALQQLRDFANLADRHKFVEAIEKIIEESRATSIVAAPGVAL
jgi:hypothetical protein